MKMTYKTNINTNSLVLRHNILLEVGNLTMGREGVLQTEKDLYLVLALMDNLIEEDLIEECNQDGRDLTTIMLEDIEPEFMKLMKQDEYKQLYEEMRQLHSQRCKEIWDNQHSMIGVIDMILTTISTMSEEDKKAALVETGKIAEAAFDRRTQELSQKTEEVNSKLEDFVRQYREKINNEEKTKSDAE